MTENVLDRIKAYKLEEVARDKATRPLSQVETEARAASPVRGFAVTLAIGIITAGGWANPSTSRPHFSFTLHMPGPIRRDRPCSRAQPATASRSASSTAMSSRLSK